MSPSTPGNPKDVPKAGVTLNRLKSGNNTLAVINKSPNRQKSSRFNVNQKIELDKLPSFKGN